MALWRSRVPEAWKVGSCLCRIGRASGKESLTSKRTEFLRPDVKPGGLMSGRWLAPCLDPMRPKRKIYKLLSQLRSPSFRTNTSPSNAANMEKTFNDPAQSQQFSSDAERQKANEQRAQQGEPQIPGAAGRESVPTKDPKGTFSPPRPSFGRTYLLADLTLRCCPAKQSSTLAVDPDRWATSPFKTLLSEPYQCKTTITPRTETSVYNTANQRLSRILQPTAPTSSAKNPTTKPSASTSRSR